MLFTNGKNVSQKNIAGKKFLRREDLTESIRISIAVRGFLAKENSEWGMITFLAKEYNVSRTFIYDLILSLSTFLSIILYKKPSQMRSISMDMVLQQILSFRMEGKCSLEATSVMMKRLGLPCNSMGFISEYLEKTGSLLPDTLKSDESETQSVIFVSDEVFAKNTPILVTVDPVSSAILKIELADARKAKNWVTHWNCIQKNGHMAIYLVSDEGTGLTSGHAKGLADIPWQPDTFHAIAHRIGIYMVRFEKSAYQAMENEYDCLSKFDSAKSDEVIARRIDNYDEAVKETLKAIELYEQFKYLYTGIIKELNVFDSNGNLRERKEAEENIIIYLELIDTFQNTTLSAATKKIRKTLKNLLNYFEKAIEIVEELKKLNINEDALKALCSGWQWHKRYIKSKRAAIRNYCKENEAFCLEITEGYIQEGCEAVKEQIYNRLNHIVQSSAMVECINSIIRPYLNMSRNNISQGMLNLIMFYHNHRRYNSGERKGKTPCEILSGKKQEKDWAELLIEVTNSNEFSINSSQISLAPMNICAYSKSDNDIICHTSSDDYTPLVKAS